MLKLRPIEAGTVDAMSTKVKKSNSTSISQSGKRCILVLSLLMASTALFVPSRASAATADQNVSADSLLARIDVVNGIWNNGTAVQTFQFELRVRLDGSESKIVAIVDGVLYEMRIRTKSAQERVTIDFSLVSSSDQESKRVQMNSKTVVVRGKKVLLGELKSPKGKKLSVSLTLVESNSTHAKKESRDRR